jgi:hypothetical protein
MSSSRTNRVSGRDNSFGGGLRSVGGSDEGGRAACAASEAFRMNSDDGGAVVDVDVISSVDSS